MRKSAPKWASIRMLICTHDTEVETPHRSADRGYFKLLLVGDQPGNNNNDSFYKASTPYLPILTCTYGTVSVSLLCKVDYRLFQLTHLHKIYARSGSWIGHHVSVLEDINRYIFFILFTFIWSTQKTAM